jgi:capsular exopolysaccharide synthesis family protein
MDIKDFIKPLLKWWWLLVISGFLGGMASYLAVRNEPDVFRARATIMIGRPFDNPNPEGSQFYLSQQLALTYADIAKRGPVRQATMTALGVSSLPNYEVMVPQQTQLIEIAATHTDPAFAQAVANEIANQLVLLSPGSEDPDQKELMDFVDGQLVKLAEQIETTQDEITILQTRLGEVSSAREIAETQRQSAALQDKLGSLQSNYTSFLANSNRKATNVLSIVESASLPNFPVGPNSRQTILMAMVLGVVLASGAAYILEYMDDSIRSEEEIRQAVGLPLLASLFNNSGANASNPLLTLHTPRSPHSEAFRVLRTRLLFLSVNNPQRILLFTSASPGEGKSYAAANSAVVMAQAGYKTILVDADLRRPTQHKIFEKANLRGLSNIILDANLPEQDRRGTPKKPLEYMLENVIQETAQNDLYAITSGPIPPNPSELIGSSGMIAILKALGERFDYVILDTAPVLSVTDTMLLSTMSDAVVVVSSADRMRAKTLKKVVERLNEMSANVVGIVVNRSQDPKLDYYSYYRDDNEDLEEEVTASKKRSIRPVDGNNGIKNRVLQFVTNSGSNQK